ncbi:MAG: transglutaminase family protein [Arachidicoccus sp.]|nr:transglutaminase family protein [Arachidicoccus sp.]
MPNYHVKHITHYLYSSPVIDTTNQIMLYPIIDDYQQLNNQNLVITGNPLIETFTDYFFNKVGMFSLVEPHSELIIKSYLEITTLPLPPINDDEPSELQWAQLDALCNQFPYIDFLQTESIDDNDELQKIINQISDKSKTPFENVKAFSEYIYQNFEYKKGVTSVETKVNEIWKLKAGVCQDFAHILLLMLRKMRIPAKYVSGYICPGDEEVRGEGATHAWIEAYIPSNGWIGFDPTNNCIVNDQHIRLAVGRNFSDCTPVKGTYKGCSEHRLQVSVVIENADNIKRIKKEQEQLNPPQMFSYISDNPLQSNNTNSYRTYIEQLQMQQQQQ